MDKIKRLEMIRLTEEQIQDINSNLEDSWNQGIYKEPFGVDHEKDYVIYQRHETGGVSGGSCWDYSNPEYYDNEKPRPNWQALDNVLKILCPEISYIRYKEIEQLVRDTSKSEYEYYGNREDFHIWYLPLEKLYEYFEKQKVT